MFDAITIGSAILDVFFKSSQFQLVKKDGSLALCETFNEKIEVEQAMISSGGAGTNVAVGLARLGFHVACLAEIGKDFAGSVIVHDLEREGVSTELLVQEKSEATGISGLLISQDGARTALVFRGAAQMITVSDLHSDLLQTNWIHLSSIGNTDVISRIFSYCKERHIRLSWNPGNWEIEAIVSGVLKPNWSAVEVLFVNKEEMEKLSGVSLEGDAWRSEWCFVGPKITVVTDGEHGGRYCIGGKCFWYEGERVETVQETGAGDAFAVGFLGGQLTNKEITQCIEYGKKNAGSVIRSMGAKTGLLRSL
ncbi:MAG: carbohydrate kinase family protein [Candidatus Pacebacteria bacterium]|nr:carbohydrate kinase family protein [Candidatus Paceibacterota bacterium]